MFCCLGVFWGCSCAPLAVKVASGTLLGGEQCFIDLLASFIDLLARFIDLLARFIDLLARFIDLLARVSQDPHCSTIYLVLTHL